MQDFIRIRGARVHNLKNISLSIPHNELTVITGVSGSGKSSLAFDTIYAEGQRRYVESLSAYARQFLERMEKPEVEDIEGIAPAQGLHPLQQKFLEQAALQCGICTPGFIVAAKALLEQSPSPSEDQVRHWLAGNLCRCTGYDKIVRAVLDAAK